MTCDTILTDCELIFSPILFFLELFYSVQELDPVKELRGTDDKSHVRPSFSGLLVSEGKRGVTYGEHSKMCQPETNTLYIFHENRIYQKQGTN